MRPDLRSTLNAEQQQAVDTLDGPLLVIAGPGTGKTQLLSARVANILEQTDTPPQNILCLTFTESGAANMRERLTRFIGPAAYDVAISTYHAFGGDLIRRYPEYFTETRLQNPVDELGRHQIVAGIVAAMPYGNPLKQTQHHLEDLISTMSEAKRALLTPADLRAIADENLQYIRHVSHAMQPLFAGFTRMPGLAKAGPIFRQLADVLAASAAPAHQHIRSLAEFAAASLETALAQAAESDSGRPLTTWKNTWLAKDDTNCFVLAGTLESKRMRALADVLEQYGAALETQGLYDFDDMISRAVKALEDNAELRYNLQERYLYLLLDEFQDTNAAQARLVALLTDNPISEGRPNIMAVGDDDQAIYAFQGARYSNMLDFYNAYRDVRVINLTKNYRSHAAILLAAEQTAGQIQERLYRRFDGASKTLEAANSALPQQAVLVRREFLSDIAQADWIAREIRSLIDRGTPAHEIAVLAPRHRQLEPLVPYLDHLGVPVRYEKRENILEAPVVRQLLTMSRLVLALADNNEAVADHLWPQVLSYDFWQLPVSRIWEMSWRIADERGAGQHASWSRMLLADGKAFRIPALLCMSMAGRAGQETGETMLDYLTGTIAADTHEADLPRVYSPLRAYYTGETVRRDDPELFYQTLSHLTVLRARLREHQQTREGALTLRDLITFTDLYEAAGERMINTSPYAQADSAVQLLTVFKAKGLEFQHVFLPSCQDDVWGSTSRGQSNRISLPANLAPIRHAGATDDERLRIFFVALTRAKVGLHLTSVTRTYTGKPTRRLKYLDEREQPDGRVEAYILPQHARTVQHDDTAPPSQKTLEKAWHHRHTDGLTDTSLRALLAGRLRDYRLSPTHLGTFLDLEYGGPERFFLSTLLRFPEAPAPDGEFGNAVHETLEWFQHQVSTRHAAPSISEAIAFFTEHMARRKLTEPRIALETERGRTALAAYLTARSAMFRPDDRAEVNFRGEQVRLGEVLLSGKVDRLEIDQKSRTITVVDYKTGKSHSRWERTPKLDRYRRQLYCYKILVENSRTFSDYRVRQGRLEFIEPDTSGRINTLEVTFTADDEEHTAQLLQALWQHVHQLRFPQTSAYSAGTSGIARFEQDLIAGIV